MTSEILSDGPFFVPKYESPTGGVDFLGLRQANLNLMAVCLPGFNNVTRYVRPFALLAWIYSKFPELLRDAGREDTSREELQIYLEKVETLFTWGHKQERFQGIPGLRAEPPADGEVPLTFRAWKRSAGNTSLMAAVQYGPAMTRGFGLGFIERVERGVYRAAGAGQRLAEVFDEVVTDAADSRALQLLTLDATHASAADANSMMKIWSVNAPTERERRVFRGALYQPSLISQWTGTGGRPMPPMRIDPAARRSATLALVLEALDEPLDEDGVRRALTYDIREGRPAALAAAQRWWLVLQLRQLQRVALECMLGWLEQGVSNGEHDTNALVDRAVAATVDADIWSSREPIAHARSRLRDRAPTVADWAAEARRDASLCCFELRSRVLAELDDDGDQVVATCVRALLVCALVTELLGSDQGVRPLLQEGGNERISLSHWAAVLSRQSHVEPKALMQHLVEVCVLSQHFATASGRFDGRVQRLRLTIDDYGLELLADRPWRPRVTPDRVGAALSLMSDCGLLSCEGGTYRAGAPPT